MCFRLDKAKPEHLGNNNRKQIFSKQEQSGKQSCGGRPGQCRYEKWVLQGLCFSQNWLWRVLETRTWLTPLCFCERAHRSEIVHFQSFLAVSEELSRWEEQSWCPAKEEKEGFWEVLSGLGPWGLETDSCSPWASLEVYQSQVHSNIMTWLYLEDLTL